MEKRIAVLTVALLSAGVLLILTLNVAQMAEPPGPWIKYTGNPVVVTGTVGSWDATVVADPSVISDGVTYKMWYTGRDAGGIWGIGDATSTNGITWTKYAGNPVLTRTAGSWDANVVVGGDVVFDGATYRMWYIGAESLAGPYAIGYATSTNGITWTKYVNNPVVTGTVGSWDSVLGCPGVISDTGLYKMWYMGADDSGIYGIGYATSTNGISWTKYAGNPVVVTGTVGSWDESRVLCPDVILDGTTYRMWYTGQDADGFRRIGYATSPDGISWTKSSSNPVLNRGLSGSWESKVMLPGVLLEGDTYKMWYTGNYEGIGYASPGSYTTPGTLVFHEADGTIVYNWFTYIPENISKTEHSYILMTGLHGYPITDEYAEITQESRKRAERRMSWANEHKYILLVPVIPRPETNHVYAVAFDWKVFLDSTDPFCQRPDFKVNLMIDKLVSDLRNDDYNVDEKVLIEGFSAGGMFAQRYALLHPERVQAIAAGQCGGAITLAESTYNGIQMDWPVGVNDFSSLVGYEFNQSAYQQVPQFIYVGDQDTNTTLWGTGELWRTQSQIDFLNNTFGYTVSVKLENQVSYLNDIGYNNITFKKYPGIGHEYTREMKEDSFAFFSDFKWPSWVYLPIIVHDYAPLALPSSIDGASED